MFVEMTFFCTYKIFHRVGRFAPAAKNSWKTSRIIKSDLHKAELTLTPRASSQTRRRHIWHYTRTHVFCDVIATAKGAGCNGRRVDVFVFIKRRAPRNMSHVMHKRCWDIVSASRKFYKKAYAKLIKIATDIFYLNDIFDLTSFSMFFIM